MRPYDQLWVVVIDRRRDLLPSLRSASSKCKTRLSKFVEIPSCFDRNT